MDGGNLAGIERLDQFGAPGRVDFAGRHRMHVELPVERPGERGGEESANRQHRHDG
jgi:hypothetical protein